MPVMSPASASGTLNPILTDHINNFVPQDLGWNAVAPIAPTTALEGTVFGFDQSTASSRLNTEKGNGENARTVEMFVGSEKYELVKHELHGVVTAETLERIKYQEVPIDLQLATVQETWERIRYNAAREVADLVTDASKYGTNNKLALTGNDKFGGTTSQLRAIAVEAKSQIKLKSRRKQVEAVIAYDAFLAALDDPLFIEQFKYTTSPNEYVGDEKAAMDLANFWKIDKVTYSDMVDEVTGGYVGSGCVVFCFTDPTEGLYVKSFAKTYQHQDYPQAYDSYRDPKSGAWYFPVASYYKPVITSADLGFLVSGCI